MAEPQKRKSIGLLLDTQSPINNPRKRSIRYRKLNKGAQRSQAPKHPSHRYSLFKRISDTLFFQAKISFYQHSFPTPKRNKNIAKSLDLLTWRTLWHKHSLCRKYCCIFCINSTVFSLLFCSWDKATLNTRKQFSLKLVYGTLWNNLWRHFLNQCTVSSNSHLKQLMVTSFALHCRFNA